MSATFRLRTPWGLPRRLSALFATSLTLGSILGAPILAPQVASAATTTYTVTVVPSPDKQVAQGGGNTGNGVNASGHIVGQGINPKISTGDAFLFRNGTSADLGNLTNSQGSVSGSIAFGINNNDVVVGNSIGPAWIRRPAPSSGRTVR